MRNMPSWEIASNFENVGFVETALVEAVDSMYWVEGTPTIIFIGSPNAITKLKEILTALDVKEDLFDITAGHFLS